MRNFENNGKLRAKGIKREKAIEEIIKQDKRYCHLCGSEEIKGGWCSNKSCAEYRKYEI